MKKSALITGGSKRIGKQIAMALGKYGYHIHLHYHQSGDQAKNCKAELEQAGISCDVIQADLQNPPEIARMIDSIRSHETRLSVIINSASLFESATLQNTEIEMWDAMMEVNFRAPWLIVKSASDLLESNNGCVINILDSGISKVWTQYAPYQISKIALAQLTKLMAKSYAPKVRVNGIAPGLIMPSGAEDAVEWEKLVNRIPMKQQGQPGDIVDGILFLLNQKYTTGEILFIDGGYQLI